MNGWRRHLCVCLHFQSVEDVCVPRCTVVPDSSWQQCVCSVTVQQDLQECVWDESHQQLWLRCPSLIAQCNFMYLDLCVCVWSSTAAGCDGWCVLGSWSHSHGWETSHSAESSTITSTFSLFYFSPPPLIIFFFFLILVIFFSVFLSPFFLSVLKQKLLQSTCSVPSCTNYCSRFFFSGFPFDVSPFRSLFSFISLHQPYIPLFWSLFPFFLM